MGTRAGAAAPALRTLVERLAELEPGWHEDYGGERITREAINSALTVVDELQLADYSAIVQPCPTPEGGVVILWEIGVHSRCIEFDPDGQAWYMSLNVQNGKVDAAEPIKPGALSLDRHIFEK
jgi:hypothetical protein